MPDSQVTIICPHCQKPVSLDDALTHQIQNKYKQDYDLQLKQEKLKLFENAKAWAKQEAEKINSLETKLRNEELEQLRKRAEIAEKSELEIRKEKIKFEAEKQNFELEKQRQLDAERDKIKNEVAKILSEEHQFKDAEKDKKINDMLKTIEELKRKAQQGSQQLQGEVLELEVEELLKSEFPLDEITAVGKGISGADVLQKVYDRSGRLCGTIAWESKRTKAWSDSWIQKLKDDQREAKAEIAVLISNTLPAGIKNFGPKDGIYVSNYECILGVATILRSSLIQLSTTKLSTVGKNEKMEVLWNYLTGTEFKQRMEAVLEAFTAMKLDLEKEKRVYTKLWSKREKQIQRVLDSTIGLRGELEGVMGKELPEMKQLDIEALADETDSSEIL